MAEVKPLGRLEPGTPEWAEARRNRLGGSEVAAALGLSSWVSPFTLWHRKRGLVGEGHESESMSWGKRLEPVILDHYASLHPDLLIAPGEAYGDDWRTGAPDGLCYLPEIGVSEGPVSLVEVKTADSNDAYEWGEDGSSDPAAVPPYYRVQCLWYMDVLGIHQMALAVLIGGNDYREYTVPWDQAEADDIRERAWKFWRTVVENIRPDLDATASTYDTVRELHPNIDGLSTEVYPPLAEHYLETDLALKQAKSDAQLAKSGLLDAMGTARLATVAGTPVARRQPGRNGSVSLYPIHPKETE